MFLLRSAFWLTLVILLIPADPQTGDAPRVTMINAIVAVRATVADLSGFCGRNPDVCATGSAAFELVADKTGDGIEMVTRFLTGEDGPDVGPVEIAMAPGTPGGTRGTLSTDDIALPWQGGPGDDPT